MFTFNLGAAQIETEDLNELRDVVEELKTKIGKGEEFSNKITDFIFDVELAYQQYYELDEDDWSIVHD